MAHAVAEEPILKRRKGWITLAICTGLLILYGILSYTAALQKSPTYDESVHAVSGYIHRTTGDFRINAEHPALFGYWVSLLLGNDAMKVDYSSSHWAAMLDDPDEHQWPLSIGTLFQTPGNNGDRIINLTRLMTTILGISLGALIAWWAWRLAGALAAVIATTLFAFDPNFLAHGSLVTNDVMITLTIAALGFLIWRCGIRAAFASVLGMAIACAAAINIKFSGLICGPIVVVALVIRGFLPEPWNVLGRVLSTIRARLTAALLICVAIALFSYAATWACYGFRSAPATDPKDGLLNMQRVVVDIKLYQMLSRLDKMEQIPDEVVHAQPVGQMSKLVLWAESHRILPQAWLFGFLFRYMTTLSHETFLLGHTSIRGWWYYFPLAMLFKTATASLIAMGMGIIIAASYLMRMRRETMDAKAIASKKKTKGPANAPFAWQWPVISFAVPVGIYLASALTTNINLGLRHVFPLYPFLYVGTAVAFAYLIHHKPRFGRISVTLLALVLAVESLAAYPDYIAFFNTPSGGWRHGIDLLGDSNLDWGQDLKQLAEWQQAHSDKKLYLCYFGTADPAYYGIQATHMPGGWTLRKSDQIPSEEEDCYVAISATALQGIYLPDDLREMYGALRRCVPETVLGGSIYVYQFPPKLKEGL